MNRVSLGGASSGDAGSAPFDFYKFDGVVKYSLTKAFVGLLRLIQPTNISHYLIFCYI